MGKLIGLTGYGGVVAGVGKDTVANYLKTYYSREFRSVAFADPIRAALKVIFGWDDSYFEHPKKNEVDPKFGVTPRKAMQTLGTEWGRNLINTNLWVNLTAEKWQPMLGAGFYVIVSDVRRDNEADAIRKAGGEIWHIDVTLRGGENAAAGAEAAHVAETAGVKFIKSRDLYIDNNEVLGFMLDQADKRVARLFYEEEMKKRAKEEAEAVARLAPYMVTPGDSPVAVNA